MTTQGPASGEAEQLTPDGIGALLDTQDWLGNQRAQYATEIAAGRAENRCISCDPETILESMDRIQAELQRASTDLRLRELLSKRVQQGDAMQSLLHPDGAGAGAGAGDGDTTDAAPAETLQRRRILQDLLTKQTALASEVLHVHKENQKVTSEVDRLQKDNLELKQELRELMDDLTKVKATAELRQTQRAGGPHVHKAQEELQQLTDKTEVLRHIFQGLVLGSGLNWAQDDELRGVTVDLGKPLDTLL